EAGVANYQVTTWYAIWAPAGTPPDIVAKLSTEVAKAMQAPSIKEVWSQQGASPGGNAPAEFAAFVKTEIAKWGDVAKQSGARID
ncbi:MAG TPA: tripartite tricarboxylate transporter substrate-binding protein, partial [Casimicrobiaceae bacterium]|nr:tripartite tricarboxylate transporter substrate-binding protein [Casimicrobiaceae bacterium]